MKCFFTQYLNDWKQRKYFKPLIVRDARQVGKTYVIEGFGKKSFTHFIKINFEKFPNFKQFFTTNNATQILQNLEVYFGKNPYIRHINFFR